MKFNTNKVVLDFGNTSVKVGVFKDNNLTESLSFQSLSELAHYLENQNFEKGCYASVTTKHKEVAQYIKNFVEVGSNANLPIQLNYKTPDSLGADRIASVCGAQILYPKSDCLIIDAGTCITYEFLDAKAIYHGGGISPGLKMRFQSLNNFTSALPLVHPSDSFEVLGKSTQECILSGVQHGVISEVDGYIAFFKAKYPNLKVIVCGGNADFFESKLKASIFVRPNLVLYGLNSILEYNNVH